MDQRPITEMIAEMQRLEEEGEVDGRLATMPAKLK